MGPERSSTHFRPDRAEVGVHHHQGADLERGRDLEDRVQRRPLAPDPVDLRVRQRQAFEAVRGPHQQDPLDVVRRLRLRDDALRPVRRARVAFTSSGRRSGKYWTRPACAAAHDVADGGRVLVAGMPTMMSACPRRWSSAEMAGVRREAGTDAPYHDGRDRQRGPRSPPAVATVSDAASAPCTSRRSRRPGGSGCFAAL